LSGDILVPEFIHQASDDQIALAVCFGAVLVSGLIMHFSHHLGQLIGRVRLHETADQSALLLKGAHPVVSRQSAEAASRERAA
jgi:hypothetical protein